MANAHTNPNALRGAESRTTEMLINLLRLEVEDMWSPDGSANELLWQAADRLEELSDLYCRFGAKSDELIKKIRVLAHKIWSANGFANAFLKEVADRIEGMESELPRCQSQRNPNPIHL